MKTNIRTLSALTLLPASVIAILLGQVITAGIATATDTEIKLEIDTGSTSTTSSTSTSPSDAPQVNCSLYASPSGSGTSCTSGAPCSLDTASSRAAAGNTVCLMAGVYQRSSTFYPRGGSSDAYITYSGGVNGEAILRWTGGQGNVINTNGANYVTIQDLTVDGAGRNYYTGVGLDNSHHVIARGLYVLNAGEAGIYALNSDYVTVDHNLVWHNGYNGYGWSSGIGLNRPAHFDRNPGFHYIFTNNIISGEYDGSSYHTDGNGIIIDGGYSSSNVTDPTLIANNVVYSNGGRCIIIYEQTGNHWAVNNTCYKNGLDLQVGGCGFSRGCSEEYFVQGSQNNRFVNNIARSWDTQHPFGGCCGSTGNPLNRNLWFGNGGNNTSSYSVTSLLNGNPLFANPPPVSDSVPGSPGQGWFNDAMDPRQLGNRLQLQSGSPAINAGIDPASLTSDGPIQAGLRQYVYQDINGATRPQGGSFDLGAYEFGGSSAPTPTLPPATLVPTATSIATSTNAPTLTATPTARRTNTPRNTSTSIPTSEPPTETYTRVPDETQIPTDTPARTGTQSSTSTPTETPSSPSVLWSADHETGDLSQWTGGCGGVEEIGSGSSTISSEEAHSGRFSDALSIVARNEGDPQAVRMYRSCEAENNREAYYSVWLYFPRRFNISSRWNVFQWQSENVYGDPTTSAPMWTIDIRNRRGNTMYFGLDYWPTGASYDQNIANIPLDRWVHLEAYYKHSYPNANSGRVTFWQDGEQIYDVRNVDTTSSANLTWSVNSYCETLSPSSATIYIDDATISTSRIGP